MLFRWLSFGYHLGMSKQRETSQILTHRREVGRSTPRRFSRTAWWRFRQDRREGLIRRIGGQPDECQAGLIEALITAEWQALELEAEARNETGKLRYAKIRLAAEHRRLWQLADRELSRVTPKRVPRSASPGLDQILQDIGTR
jgi:hypothetical protein